MEDDSLRIAIRLLIEDLGHLSKNIVKGYGSSSATTRTSKPSLGDAEAEDLGDVPDLTPVKVSKVFLAAQEEDEPAEA